METVPCRPLILFARLQSVYYWATSPAKQEKALMWGYDAEQSFLCNDFESSTLFHTDIECTLFANPFTGTCWCVVVSHHFFMEPVTPVIWVDTTHLYKTAYRKQLTASSRVWSDMMWYARYHQSWKWFSKKSSLSCHLWMSPTAVVDFFFFLPVKTMTFST